MKSFPLFLPAEGDHVATVVTVPDESPHGLVLVLAGTGRHNVIGSTLAAKLAGRLAAEGLASVRLDYAGVGDSPGIVPTWTPSEIEATARQARTAVREAGAALGLSRFAEVGTCYGSRVALSLAGDSGCAGAVCLAPPLVEHAEWSRPGARSARGRTVALLRRSRTVRRLARPLSRRLRAGKPSAKAVGTLANLDRTRLVFLYGKDGAEDHWTPEVGRAIDTALAALPPDRRARFELRFLEAGPLTTFDGLSLDDQATILDAVVPYVLECFDVGRSATAPVPGPAA